MQWYLETAKISFNNVMEPKFTKDNITITLTTNDDKTNPEEQLKKLNKLFFKIGCFEHSFKSFELTKIIQLKKKLWQSIYFY